MDNIESSPTLLIPVIPETDCPKGNLVQVLNYVFQTYLGQATINIPGLGDVTPAQIAALQEQDILLQAEISAIAGSVRYGTSSVAAGDSSVTITFDTAMPTSTYDIHIELVDSAAGATVVFSWSVLSKSASGFTLKMVDIPVTITTFNYSARQLA